MAVPVDCVGSKRDAGRPDLAADSAMAPDVIAPAVVARAAQWMARLWSEDATEQDRHDCARWCAEHPHHALAWHRLQAFEDKLGSVPRELARHALREPAATAWLGRRRALQSLMLLGSAGGLAYLAAGRGGGLSAAEHAATAIGEIREVMLPDGSRIVLASDSAIGLSFSADARQVILLSGEVFVATAPDTAPAHRPFRVQDRHGVVQALGTRFSMRQHDGHSSVAVFDGAVAVQPADPDSTAMRIDAGQSAMFTRQAVHPPTAASRSDAAWVRGVLVAEDMPLHVFVAALSRYRRGLLRCDPDIADLKVTGVFSLKDTDRALQSLALGLPVRTVWRSRWWGTVRAAPA